MDCQSNFPKSDYKTKQNETKNNIVVKIFKTVEEQLFLEPKQIFADKFAPLSRVRD